MINNFEVGQRIKNLRKKHNISIFMLADYLDVSHFFITSVENGSRSTKISNFIKLANLFNVSLEYIFLGREVEEFKIYSFNNECDLRLTDYQLNIVYRFAILISIYNVTESDFDSINKILDIWFADR